MSQLTVTVNNRAYDMSCEDGQEEHLRKLAEDLDRRVRDLSVSLGSVGDSRLLVIAGLLIADELSDSRGEVVALKRKCANLTSEVTRLEEARAKDDHSVGETLNHAATRIETLARKLQLD